MENGRWQIGLLLVFRGNSTRGKRKQRRVRQCPYEYNIAIRAGPSWRSGDEMSEGRGVSRVLWD